MTFAKFGEFSVIISLSIGLLDSLLSPPLWDSDNTNATPLFIVPEIPQESLYSLFYSIFSLCCLDWVIFLVLFSSSWILSWILSILLFSLSPELFLLFIVFFTFKIPAWVFFISSIPLLRLCIFLFKSVCNFFLKHFADGLYKTFVRYFYHHSQPDVELH